MEIVLLERVENLGAMGDVVSVKPGYARNFLLPQKKALRATKANIERFEREREALEKLNEERKSEAEKEAGKIDGETIVMIRQAGDTGQLYGSVSSRDIADAVAETGHKIGRSQVKLDIPIKSIGLYEIEIRLHPEVGATVTVNVARTADEAERQAKGENIIEAEREEERAAAIADRTGLSEDEVAEIFEEGAAPESLAESEEGESDAEAAAEGDSETAEAGSEAAGESAEETDADKT